MENIEANNRGRQQLSSDLLISTILICIFLFLLFLLLSDYRRTDLSTLITYALLFIALLFILIYILTRPTIYFDSTAVHIKNIKGNETAILFTQLESVKSTILNYGFSTYFSMYKISYWDRGSLASFKVVVNNFGNPIAVFQKAVEEVNPKVTL